jgi:hypothetical protein
MSNRLIILKNLKRDFGPSNYLFQIINPDIRNIFTRLRIDLNVLQSCATYKQRNEEACPCCKKSQESVEHFLLRCEYFSDIRLEFNAKVEHCIRNFKYLNDNDKLQCILDLDPENRSNSKENFIKHVCTFVQTIYKKRSNLKI